MLSPCRSDTPGAILGTKKKEPSWAPLFFSSFLVVFNEVFTLVVKPVGLQIIELAPTIKRCSAAY